MKYYRITIQNKIIGKILMNNNVHMSKLYAILKTKYQDFKIVSLILLLILSFQSYKILKGLQTSSDKLAEQLNMISSSSDAIAGHVVVPYKFVGNFSASFYCPCEICTGSAGIGRTATGVKPIPFKTVAVDPHVIPLHSILYIPKYGFFVAEDTGGAIKGHKIDIFVNSHAEALKQGKKSVKVYILQTP